MPTIRIPPRNYTKTSTSSSTATSSSSTPSRERQIFGLDEEGYEQDDIEELMKEAINEKRKRPIAGSNRVLKSMIHQAAANGEPLHSFNTQPAVHGFVDVGTVPNQCFNTQQPMHPMSGAPVFGVNGAVQNNTMDCAMDVDTDVTMEDVSSS
ncbi:hypothetical protein BJ165DRAFT_1526825 [Panaeolus papilionaceus]|nr:hypothetical protein BJ165DRAFT_1526825 [Panaeolus papilionaceus]